MYNGCVGAVGSPKEADARCEAPLQTHSPSTPEGRSVFPHRPPRIRKSARSPNGDCPRRRHQASRIVAINSSPAHGLDQRKDDTAAGAEVRKEVLEERVEFVHAAIIQEGRRVVIRNPQGRASASGVGMFGAECCRLLRSRVTSDE